MKAMTASVMLAIALVVPNGSAAQTVGFQVTTILGDEAQAHLGSRSQLSIKLQHPHPIAVSDFNNDGVPDLAVAEPDEGRVFILFGPISRPATVDLATQAQVVISGPASTGYSLAAVNVNGELGLAIGCPDSSCVWVLPVPATSLTLDPATVPNGGLLLQPESAFSFGASIVALGGKQIAIGAPDSGLVYVFSIQATSVSETLSSGNALRVSGPTSFGVAVGEADLSGAGTTDLIIGAPGSDRPPIFAQPAPNTGAVFVFHDPPAVGSLTADQASFVRYGENTGDAFGFEILTQDFNGDGIADLTVSAPFWSGSSLGDPKAGTAYFYPSGPSLLGQPTFVRYDGGAQNSLVGFALTTGTFQAGVPALIVGAPGPGLNVGGTGSVGEWVASPSLLGNFSGQGYIPEGQFQLAQQFGRSFAVGDLDGDGAADLVVAEPQYTPDGRSGAGAVQILWGTVIPLVVNPATLPNGTVGSSYQATLAPTGGVGPYHYRGNSLPPGLLVDTLTGAITGTPSQAGDFTASVSVFDDLGESLPAKLSIHIAPATPTGPEIDSLQLSGRTLTVTGQRFDGGAVVLVNGTAVKRTVDESSTMLLGKKATLLIPVGSTVTVQVRNGDGGLSNTKNFNR